MNIAQVAVQENLIFRYYPFPLGSYDTNVIYLINYRKILTKYDLASWLRVGLLELSTEIQGSLNRLKKNGDTSYEPFINFIWFVV